MSTPYWFEAPYLTAGDVRKYWVRQDQTVDSNTLCNIRGSLSAFLILKKTEASVYDIALPCVCMCKDP
jgi:hypothetical protein